ncbi:anti-sigma B factor RsbW [Paenibacillus sp. GCM10023252]|uniref:anti-sigma B factor RsbW n=1 Tax=Paenibacillus sp. GCM10023252 TaxID=3252649 RepID=UPI003613A332
MKRIKLQIPAEAENMELVRLTLYGIASKMGFSYEEIEDMKVAVGEACNNAILHAYPEQEAAGVIDLEFQTDTNYMTILVKDHGPSFELQDSYKDAAMLGGQSISELKVGGLGIYLMQALMDEVEVQTGAGTEVRMTKYREAREPQGN